MLSRDALILSTGTVGNPSLPDLVDAAVAGGYAELAVWPMDYRRWREEGTADAEARRRLDGAGLTVSQLDTLLMWSLGPGSQRAVAEETELFDVAQTLGAGIVSAIGPGDDRFTVDQLAETLAGVCDRGRERGFTIALEVSPWKGNLDLPTAVELIRRTGRDNAGLVIDSWHMFRGETAGDQLRAVPDAMVTSIQISDAPREAQPDLVAETMGGRLLPGDGVIDLGDFLGALDRPDAAAAVTVEVLSDAVRADGPVEAARRTAFATRAVLASALS
jgi:sugar phosphate isomerase/epimerase